MNSSATSRNDGASGPLGLSESPRNPKEPLLVRREEYSLRRQQLPGNIQEVSLPLIGVARDPDLELDLSGAVQDAIEPAIPFVQKSGDLLADSRERVSLV